MSTPSISKSQVIHVADSSEQNLYMPAVLGNLRGTRVEAVDLNYVHAPDGRYLYTYKVDWELIKNPLTSSASSTPSITSSELSTLRTRSLSASTQTSNNSDSRPSDLCSFTLDANNARDSRESRGRQQKPSADQRCDGPCGRSNFEPSQLRVMGLCEHAICSRCLEMAPRIPTAFGVLGCPNKRCYLLDAASLCPDRTKRADQYRRIIKCQCQEPSINSNFSVTSGSSSSSSYDRSLSSGASTITPYMPTPYQGSSTISSPSRSLIALQRENVAEHLVNVIVCVLRNDLSGRQYLRKNYFEVSSASMLGKALDSVIEDLPEIRRLNVDGRCFIGPCNYLEALDRSTWRPISRRNFDVPLSAIEDENMKVMMIIDIIGHYA